MKLKSKKNLLNKLKFYKIKGTPSIKNKLILGFILFAVMPLITVSIVSYIMSRNTLRETSLHFTSELINQTSSNIEYHLNSVEKKTINITLEPLINDSLKNYAVLPVWEKSIVFRDIEKRLNALSSIDDVISEIQIILGNGETIRTRDSVTDADIELLEKLASQSGGIWQKGLGDDSDGIYHIRSINNISTGKNIGIAKVTMKSNTLVETIKKINILEGSSIYITDENGRMIYSSDENQEVVEEHIWNAATDAEGSDTVNGVLVNYITLTNDWKVIATTPERSLTSKLDFTNTIVLTLIVLATVLATGFGMLVSKNFSKPIIKLMTLMKSAEQGDLTVTIDANRKDELGMLCNSFNHMISNIRNLLKETNVVVANTVNDGKLLKDSAEYSVEAFKQLSLSISDIAAGACNQALNTEKGTQSMYALSESIQDVMFNTKEVVSRNQDAKEIIKDTTESIKQLNETMSSSMQVSDQIKSSIIELSGLTRNIEEVMKMLDGISEQTNLLALNASIEAARAGAAGRGFAVVATEVRNLAEQSKDSTKNIRITLGTIQNKTKEAVGLAKHANHIITNQDQSVKNTFQSFSNIIELLKNMDISLDQVNSKINYMEELKDDTIQKIEIIGAVTSDTVATTQEVNALSEEQNAIIEQLFAVSSKLTSSMDDLNTSINYFKVK